MKRPLLIIIVLILITTVLLQNSGLLTGAATTKSYLHIFANSSLFTEFTEYSPGTNVTIEGYQFSGNSIIKLDIRNSTGSSVFGFPMNVTTNASGEFVKVWNVGNTTLGNYIIYAIDFNNSQLNRSRQIQILPPYSWIGRIIDPENDSVKSHVLVYDELGNLIASDDENYTLTFLWGMLYDVYVYPVNVTGLDLVHYIFMANEGPAGDILVIDDQANNATNLLRNNLTQLAAVDPLIKNYELLSLHLSHPPAKDAKLYKCTDWDFMARTCINNFALLQNIPDSAITTNISLMPGDPALGIYQPAPAVPVPGGAPAIPAGPPAIMVPPAPLIPAMIFYIGDFAVQQSFTQWFDVGESWIFTFKGVNHTVEELRTTTDSIDLKIDYKNLTIGLGQTVQIDADQNDIPDIEFTLNQIEGTKANMTLKLPPETILILKYIYMIPELYYWLLLLLVLAIIYLYRKREKHKR